MRITDYFNNFWKFNNMLNAVGNAPETNMIIYNNLKKEFDDDCNDVEKFCVSYCRTI